MRVNGFTLIELLVAMAILGILGAIAAPNLGSYQRSVALKEARNQVVQTLRDASARAIIESAPQTVTFSLNEGSGHDLEVSSGGVTNKTVNLERDAVLSLVTSNSVALTSVIFDVRGRPNNSAPVVIATTLGDQSGQVRLLPTGKTVIR
jgi:prepilin-type N-terminal cleavage/methylation domain-containing protein